MRNLCALLVLATIAGAPVTATARRGEGKSAAEAHFSAADHAYRAGRYRVAVAELRAGFELDPRPEYRVALAQAYRKNSQPRDALRQCQLYLASGGESDRALVAVVKKLQDKLRVELGSSDEAEDPSPATTAPTTAPAEPPRAVDADGATDDDEPLPTDQREPQPPPVKPAAPARRAATRASSPSLLAVATTPPVSPSPPSWWSAHRRTAILAIAGAAVAIGVTITVAAVEVDAAPGTPRTTLGTVGF